MKTILSVALFSFLFSACNSSGNASIASNKEQTINNADKKDSNGDVSSGRWKGTFSNGMKGATISFEVDGNKMKDLTFQGYWRCAGKLEQTTIGPGTAYVIKGKTAEGTIKESGFYFEVNGNFNGSKASGTLRFAFVAGGCDTYKLNWTAEKE